MTNPTSALASFVAGSRWDSIPRSTRDAARRLLLDAIASALIGWTSPESQRIHEAARTTFGPGTSTTIGAQPCSPAGAAMTNAYLITARSFCDVHRPTLCHVTPVVVPAALAAAERAGADGATLLAGLAVGMEVVVRIGIALDYPEFRRRGWHTPGVAGPLGAAAAASRIGGAAPEVVRDALGLAGSQSGGTFASLGSPAIKFHQARAAAAGVVAFDLAATGFRASSDILTHPDGGLLGTFSSGGDPDELTRRLGEMWHLHEISTRRWPAAAALQGLIGSLLDADFDRNEVASVRVGLAPESYEMNADVGWETSFAATLSARWVAAVVIEDGACWLDQFTPERLDDPGTRRLAEIVEVFMDRGLHEGGVDLTVGLRDGRTLHDRWETDGATPGTWDSTVQKLERAASGVLADDRAEQLIETILDLEAAPEVTGLTGLLGR